jgi:hypothetical protein
VTGIAVPPVNRVEWKGAVRIIRSIYPPIDGSHSHSIHSTANDPFYRQPEMPTNALLAHAETPGHLRHAHLPRHHKD